MENKFIIREYYQLQSNPELIKEAEENKKPIIIKGILQKADTLNRNGRVYPFDILKREADRFQNEIKNNCAAGELDHPDSAIISLANASHRIVEMWWEGEELHGRIQVMEHTDAGRNLKGLLLGGLTLGISSRGVGSVKSKNGKDIVQEDFELVTFDVVSTPSTPGAYLFKEGREWGLTPIKEADYNLLKQEKYNKYSDLFNLNQQDFWKKLK